MHLRPPRALFEPLAVLTTSGLFLGLGVVFLLSANLGLTPYDVLVSGVTEQLPVTYGQASWVVAGTLMSLAALLGQPPKPFNVVFAIYVGFVIDVVREFVPMFVGSALIVRAASFGLGLVLVALGAAISIVMKRPPAALELLMAAGEARDVSPVKTRSGLEWGCFFIGAALGGSWGFGTAAAALVFPPLLGQFVTHVPKLSGARVQSHPRERPRAS